MLFLRDLINFEKLKRNTLKHYSPLFILFFVTTFYSFSQNQETEKEIAKSERKINFSVLNQTWIRYTDLNPGTEIFGNKAEEKLDIGLRRTRFIASGRIHPKVFTFFQIGINNFNFTSERKADFFIHDAWAHYDLIDEKLSIGTGLTPFSGYARYSTPSAGTILSLDAPLFQQSTGDINDQFLRGLSVYAKGRLGNLDYHLAITDPLAIQQSAINTNLDTVSSYSLKIAKKVYQGYFSYQFKDKESNNTPYLPGTYFGEKEVFNIGAGFKYQQGALWRLENNDTIDEDIVLFAIDLFYESKLNAEKGNVITLYTGYFNTTFGKDYLRNVGVMNPATGVDISNASFNGAGNAFPLTGSGSTVYLQLGYLISENLPIQPYFNFTYNDFERLNSSTTVYEAGFNYLIDGHNIKLTLGTQFRPIIDLNTLKQSDHKGMHMIQVQVKI